MKILKLLIKLFTFRNYFYFSIIDIFFLISHEVTVRNLFQISSNITLLKNDLKNIIGYNNLDKERLPLNIEYFNPKNNFKILSYTHPYGFNLTKFFENKKPENISLDLDGYLPSIYIDKNNFIGFKEKQLAKFHLGEDFSIKKIWEVETQHVLHHWGSSYKNISVMPSRIFESNNQYENLLSETICKREDITLIDNLFVFDNYNGKVVDEIDILKSLNNYQNFSKHHLLNCGDIIHLNDVDIITKQQSLSIPIFSEGDYLISLAANHTLLLIDKDTHQIKWHLYGHSSQQHSPVVLENGTILIFDNFGSDPINGRSRIIQVDPIKKLILAAFEAKDFHFETYTRGRIYISDKDFIIESSNQGEIFSLKCKHDILIDCEYNKLMKVKVIGNGIFSSFIF